MNCNAEVQSRNAKSAGERAVPEFKLECAFEFEIPSGMVDVTRKRKASMGIEMQV